MIDITFTKEEAELLRLALLLKFKTLEDLITFCGNENIPIANSLVLDREQVLKILFKVELGINEK